MIHGGRLQFKKMNYQIKYDGAYFYPSRKSFFNRKMLFPTFPYEPNYTNENTREGTQILPNFQANWVCPRFRDKMRCIQVVDRFLFIQKAYSLDTLIMPVLYCKPIWQKNNDDGDFFESNYPLENPKRILWNCSGIWEIAFVIKTLPKDICYDTIGFRNLFTSKNEAESALHTAIYDYVSA